MGTLVLAGATSGSATLTPVDAVTAVITLPSATATVATYEGMSQETIIAMLNDRSLTAEFIDEATYNEEVANQEKLRLKAK